MRHYPHIFDFLGFCPYDPGWTFGERLRARREAQGLSRKQLAGVLGVDEGTLRRWEQATAAPGRNTHRRVRALLAGTWAVE